VFAGLDEAMASSPESWPSPYWCCPAPPLPGLPEHMIGTPILMVLVVYTGPLADYETAMNSVRALASPLSDMVAPTNWQQIPWSIRSSRWDAGSTWAAGICQR